MGAIFDTEAIRQVVVNAFAQLGDTIATIFPSLVGTLALLLVGWVVSRIAEAIARGALERVGLDGAAAKIRLSETLKRSGISAAPSRIIGRLLFWIVMMTFVVSAADALGLEAATATIDRLIGYLPRVIAASLIVFAGLLLGRVSRTVVTSAAVAADIGQSERLGAGARSLVVVLMAVLALEQLGIETTLVVTLLTVLVAGATLTLGTAFALGARPVIGHILAGHFLRQTLVHGSMVEIGDRKGRVERVGSVETLLRDDTRLWSMPNGALLEQVILR